MSEHYKLRSSQVDILRVLIRNHYQTGGMGWLSRSVVANRSGVRIDMLCPFLGSGDRYQDGVDVWEEAERRVSSLKNYVPGEVGCQCLLRLGYVRTTKVVVIFGGLEEWRYQVTEAGIKAYERHKSTPDVAARKESRNVAANKSASA